jgi:Domain of unknown function (DUF4352)
MVRWFSALLVPPALGGAIIGSSPVHARQAPVATPAAAVLAGISAQTGYAVPIIDPSGVRLLIVLNGVGDFTAQPGVPEPVGGRWITLDLSITNVGEDDFSLAASNFQILSGNATVFQATTDSNLPQPQFPAATLPAGGTVRGKVIFNIPTTQILQSALFEAAGTTQFVIAPIGH